MKMKYLSALAIAVSVCLLVGCSNKTENVIDDNIQIQSSEVVEQSEMAEQIPIESDSNIAATDDIKTDIKYVKSKSTTYDKDGNIESWDEGFEYDAYGNVIKYNEYSYYWEPISAKEVLGEYQFTFEYDDNGNMIKSTEHTPADVTLPTILENDENGRPVKFYFGRKEDTDFYGEYTYDDNTNTCTNNQYRKDDSGNWLPVITIVETYDEKGNTIQRNGNNFVLEYDEHDNLIKSSEYSKEDGSLLRWTEYEYIEFTPENK